MLGIVKKLFRSVSLDNLPVVHKQYTVGNAFSESLDRLSVLELSPSKSGDALPRGGRSGYARGSCARSE